MSCTKTLDFSLAQTGDFGMDNAIYDTTTGTIIGVRGQWIFQFDADTGAFIQGIRFSDSAVSPSSICQVGTRLYLGVANSPITDFTGSPLTPFNNRDIISFNPNGTWSLANITGSFGFGSKDDQTTALAPIGWGVMIRAGSLIAGFNPQTPRLWQTNPATPLPSYARANLASLITDLAYDSVNAVIWAASPTSPNIFAVDATDVTGSDCFDTGGVSDPCGITYNVAQNKSFAVNGTINFYEVSASGHFPAFTNFPVTGRVLGNINATPVRIKSVNQAGNPRNGQVLIPTWKGDSVIAWNPFTNAQISEQTGFTAPFDVVSTPTKNWAIQTGIAGLREIV